MKRPLRIGLLHPGEMGISVAASAQNSGCEVAWVSDGRGNSTLKRAASGGLEDAGTLRRLADRCPIVLSICPPHAAEQVARSVLDAGFRGVYVDANAIAPERSIALAKTMEAEGVRFVDGGIVGKPAWQTGTTWLHLSGEAASEVAECFAAGPLHTTILGDAVGRASALKMCFAANTKGTTALLAAIVGAAERFGVREALEAQWDAWNPGFASQVSDRVRNVTRKAWRFEGEMREISSTFNAAGMPGGFHAAAGEVYRRLAAYKDVETPPELVDVLDVLLGNTDSAAAGVGVSEDEADFRIRPGTPADIPAILELVLGLADYEKLTDAVSATEDRLRNTLFGAKPSAEVLLGVPGTDADADADAVGMAIFFENYSTFLARPGLYLEDLFVTPRWRGRGLGRQLLARLASIAVERNCGRLEWAVLDWNEPAIEFYRHCGARMLPEWNLCRVTGEALRELAGNGA